MTNRYSRVMTDAATWPGVFLCGKDALAVARRLDEYVAAFRLPDAGLERVEAKRHLAETRRLSALLRSCWVAADGAESNLEAMTAPISDGDFTIDRAPAEFWRTKTP